YALAMPGWIGRSLSHTRRSGPSEVASWANSSCRVPSGRRTMRAVPVVLCSWETNEPCATTTGTAGPAGLPGAVETDPVGPAEATGTASVSCTVVLVNSFHGANQYSPNAPASASTTARLHTIRLRSMIQLTARPAPGPVTGFLPLHQNQSSQFDVSCDRG